MGFSSVRRVRVEDDARGLCTQELQITYDDDRLPALAAMAKKMNSFRRDDTYLAGLWKNTPTDDLQWGRRSLNAPLRSATHTPSWSWASTKGQVVFPLAPVLPSFELVDVSYIPDGPPHMGKSTESSLKLRGPIGRVGINDLLPHTHNARLHVEVADGYSFSLYELKLTSTLDSKFLEEDATETDERFIVLFMASEAASKYFPQSFSGLLLRKISAAADERVGWSHVSFFGELKRWGTPSGSISYSESTSGGFTDRSGHDADVESPLDCGVSRSDATPAIENAPRGKVLDQERDFDVCTVEDHLMSMNWDRPANNFLTGLQTVSTDSYAVSGLQISNTSIDCKPFIARNMALKEPAADTVTQDIWPDICICCNRSKAPGTFFGLTISHRWDSWEFASWQATIETFRTAAKQGCCRCGFVYDAVAAYIRGGVHFDFDTIRVENGCHFRFGMHTEVRIDLSQDDPLRSSKLPWNIYAQTVHRDETTSTRALAKAKDWMNECQSSHEYCDANSTAPLPKRVLELSEKVVVLREHVRPEIQRYACLSHCWGPQGPAIQLNKTSRASLMRGIPLKDLPKTFSDTVKVCLELGISFLWIDALCKRKTSLNLDHRAKFMEQGIYQDDLSDWEQAAGTMADIYQHAWITIAATSARDSNDGLRRPVGDRFRPRLIPSIGMYVRESYVESSNMIYPDEELFPLVWRAWAFQEKHLSPRTLSFSIYRMVWGCRSFERIEHAPYQHRWTYDETTWGPQYFYKRAKDPVTAWQYMVRNFAYLRVTYDSDRLPSIAALASIMSQQRNGDLYLCGLWRNSLLNDLQWTARSEMPRCRSKAPTWSWASVNGKISFERGLNKPPYVLPSVTLLDVQYHPTGPAFFGQSTSAHIRLSGYTTKVVWKDPLNCDRYDQFEVEDLKGFDIKTESLVDFDPNSDPISRSPNEALIMVFITIEFELRFAYSGMILRKLCGARYERVGWMRLFRSLRRIRIQPPSPDYWVPLDAYMATLTSSIEEVTIV
ncbi:hypothetical protein OPT61_g8007 [Boeremia exigua]|uniref:Uncharacterized protein n=1 Tax=Boeremia exigua TaxID=749465 RepID=A0ACC2I143_9PLEO|nr:hypothetical protein OPT61_g8007 [Boeremia exigua]